MTENLMTRLGLNPVVNAIGTMTMLGGSLMDPSVLDAMREASKSYVELAELHDRAGAYIAELLGVEGACITCGAAAGMTIATAACMAGKDPLKIEQLPNTLEMRNTCVVLAAHDSPFIQGIRMAGARIVMAGEKNSRLEPQELASLLNDQVACVFYIAESTEVVGSLPLSEVIAIAHAHNVPVLVDAAAEIPPQTSYKEMLSLGADLVILSGGKELRGPQSSGLILGRLDLIACCNANGCPHHSIGRPMKVDKETIAGLTRAVELYLAKDYSVEMVRWKAWMAEMVALCVQHPSLTCYEGYPKNPGVQPTIIPRAYFRHSEIGSEQFADELKKLGIWVWVENEWIVVNPQCLDYKQVELITQSIIAVASVFSNKQHAL